MMKLDLSHPDEVHLETPSGWAKADDIHGGAWAAGAVALQLTEGENGIALSLHAKDTPVLAVAVRWNTGFAHGTRVMGDAWERGYGDLGWYCIQPERLLSWYVVIDEGASLSALGVRTQASAMVSWKLDACGITLIADTSVGSQGVRLQGRPLSLCTVVTRRSAGPADAFQFVCAFMRDLCDAPKRPPALVYGGNNWYYAYGDSSQEAILRDSAFIAEMAEGLPERPYMVIDDGWQVTGGPGGVNGGPWTGNDRFPDMPGLASSMKGLGVKPGLWIRPLLTSERVPDAWVRGTQSGGGQLLDPTNPAVLDYVGEIVDRVAGWGYQLIKHDFTTFDIYGVWGKQRTGYRSFTGKPFLDDRFTMAEHIVRLYRRIAKRANGACVIGCNTIGHLCAGLFALQRTGDDTSGRSWERTRRMGINTLAMRMPQHHAFFECDADCASITGQVDWPMSAKWLELLSCSGTPLFVSANGDQLTAQQRTAVRNAFVTASKALPPAVPLDWQTTTSPAEWHIGGAIRSFDWHEPGSFNAPLEG